jgi:hypothetical protein
MGEAVEDEEVEEVVLVGSWGTVRAKKLEAVKLGIWATMKLGI